MLCAAVDKWGDHATVCEDEPCGVCDAGFNQVRLALKVWRSSRYKATTQAGRGIRQGDGAGDDALGTVAPASPGESFMLCVRKHLRDMPRYWMKIGNLEGRPQVPCYIASDVQRAVDLAMLEIDPSSGAGQPSSDTTRATDPNTHGWIEGKL